MAQQSCYLEGEILTRAQFQLSTECPPFSYSHHMPRITCQTRQCLSSCWHVASVDITPETCWEKKAWTSCAYWAGWVCDFALSQLCSCVTGGHSQKPVWAELPREHTAVVKKTVCPEEGYNCVCPLNYRVWQRVFCASMFKMLATDWCWRSEICVCSGGTIRDRWNVLRVVLPEDFLLLFWADSISELFHVTDYQMRPMNAS